MSFHLYRLGGWAFRARKLVVALWVLVLVATATGSALLARPSVEGFAIPGTEAQEAMDSLSETFPQMSGASAQVVVVAPEGASLAGDPFIEPLGSAVADLRAVDGVVSVSDPYEVGGGGGLSADETAALLTVQLDRSVDEVPESTTAGVQEATQQLQEVLPPGTEVSVGGEAFSSMDVPHDNASEIMGMALAFVVLLVAFGSLVAAGQPLITAVVGVGITLTAIELVTSFTDVSSTAPVLATMLGLAVGIDYALFVLSRHVGQLRAGMDPEESVARSVATAGSAVVFAGLTVVIALVGLAIVDIPFMTVMGLAGAAAVALAVLVSLTLTPALLGMSSGVMVRSLARRESRRATRRRAKDGRRSSIDEASAPAHPARPARFFARWVRIATVRPLVTIGLVVGTVGLLSVPALDLRLGLLDAGSQPAESSARQTYDAVAEHFGPGYNGPLLVTGPIASSQDPVSLMADLREELIEIDAVSAIPVATPDPTGTTGLLTIIPQGAPDSAQTEQLVEAIRSAAVGIEDEHGVALSVTGQTAAGIDVSTLLSDALLPYVAFIVLLSLVLLTMVFRSLWVPIKATVGFLLTIGSALGAVSLVYSWGWFAGPLGVDQTGAVISFMPIIVLGVLFGLAMDYEVFLVSTIREEYVHGAAARPAITRGFARSAPVVTAAALIMFAVFATFVPAADSTIKPIALALAVGVFVDAFVVRMTFVPAVMTLLGDRAWSMPSWLDRRLPSFDIEGERLTRRLDSAREPDAVDAGTPVAAAERR